MVKRGIPTRNGAIHVGAFLVQQPHRQRQTLYVTNSHEQGRASTIIPVIDPSWIGFHSLPQLHLVHTSERKFLRCRRRHPLSAGTALVARVLDAGLCGGVYGYGWFVCWWSHYFSSFVFLAFCWLPGTAVVALVAAAPTTTITTSAAAAAAAAVATQALFAPYSRLRAINH